VFLPISNRATVSQRGLVVFRAQHDLTDDLQKALAQKLGELTGKPSTSTLHIHPLAKHGDYEDKTRHLITTDPKKKPAEDRFRNQAEQPMGVRAAWHTDISYEPNPADYSILKMVQLPERGGGE
jgi:alpha-ketoglutarate-dependent taurine dioxygenase